LNKAAAGRSLIASLLVLAWMPAGWASTPTANTPSALAPSCPPSTPDSKPAIDPAAINALEACLQQLPQTKTLHWRQNRYAADRQRLHAQIVASTRTGARCVKPGVQPLAVLTGGPPGAGKSTWLAHHLPSLMQPGWLRIDADELRAQLPEYRGWNSNQTHSETSDLVNSLLATIGRPCNTNLLYDGTLTSPRRYLELLPRLKKLGYRTFIVQVMVPESVSRQRSLERYQRTGRYVPEEAIQSYYTQAAATFALLKTKVDGTVQVDGLNNRTVSTSGQPLPITMLNLAP
jgi:predicted ABC-type ATPase